MAESEKNNFIQCFHATLHGFQRQGIFCDVTLRVKQQKYLAHRSVLAACSPYFRAMFSNEMLENMSGIVHLTGIDSTSVEAFLDYIYTGDVALNEVNASCLLIAADYYLLPCLKDLCEEFLKRNLNATNCLRVRNMAIQYRCEDLEKATMNYLSNHFLTIAKTEEFLEISVDEVKDLISREELNFTEAKQEEGLVEVVTEWIQWDRESRTRFTEELLSCLRFSAMTKQFLHNVVQNHDLVKNSSQFSKILNCQAINKRQNPRGVEEAVVFFGGKKALCFVPSTNQCSEFKPGENHSYYIANVINLGGYLYVVVESSGSYNCLERFDPQKNSWSVLSCMPKQLRLVSAVAVNERLYFLGGQKQNRSTEDVVCYDPAGKKWLDVACMNSARSGLCTVALNDSIFAIGGFNGDQLHLNTAERYDRESDRWVSISPMAKKRAFSCGTTLNQQLLVVGGEESSEGGVHSSCEVYDPSRDQWSLLPASLLTPRSRAGIARVRNKIFIFGGRGAAESAECYDEEEMRWSTVQPGQGRPRELTQYCALVCLPKSSLSHAQ